jgi:hypothetical protein
MISCAVSTSVRCTGAETEAVSVFCPGGRAITVVNAPQTNAATIPHRKPIAHTPPEFWYESRVGEVQPTAIA